jgi:sulfhydrogenase subunit beta (sulfur reductase)
MTQALLSKADIDALIQVLKDRGYRVLGPRLQAGAIVFDELDRADELPRGLRSVQEPGRYRIEERGDDRLFDYVNGPESLKRLLFAPEEMLWRVSADGQVRFNETFEQPLTAVIGARACDLAGMLVQDRTFIAGQYSPFTDPYYEGRRNKLFVVAVNCVTTAPTCFCASMETGPRAKQGFDLALTELQGDFLLETGTDAGETIAQALPLRPAKASEQRQADAAIASAAQAQVRSLDVKDVHELLFSNLDHPRWDDVAARCLSCGNCVMVCPTCFCHREYDEPSLDGTESRHVRRWDACYTLEHGSTHGAYLRPQVKQRYRQWLTHKVAAWIPQFGVSGCVGCGRCITWCPTGIDLTEEVAAIRATSGLRA